MQKLHSKATARCTQSMVISSICWSHGVKLDNEWPQGTQHSASDTRKQQSRSRQSPGLPNEMKDHRRVLLHAPMHSKSITVAERTHGVIVCAVSSHCVVGHACLDAPCIHWTWSMTIYFLSKSRGFVCSLKFRLNGHLFDNSLQETLLNHVSCVLFR